MTDKSCPGYDNYEGGNDDSYGGGPMPMSVKNKSLNREELKEKLYNLNKRLVEVNELKKCAAQDYRDQLNDIKDEIKDTLNQLDEGRME